jgi:hypothetical protein
VTLNDTAHEHSGFLEGIRMQLGPSPGLEWRCNRLLNQPRLTLDAGASAKLGNRQEIEPECHNCQTADNLNGTGEIRRAKVDLVEELKGDPVNYVANWVSILHLPLRLCQLLQDLAHIRALDNLTKELVWRLGKGLGRSPDGSVAGRGCPLFLDGAPIRCAHDTPYFPS